MPLSAAAMVVLLAAAELAGTASVPAATDCAVVDRVEGDDVFEHADASARIIARVEHRRTQSIWL
jgi:hypothetical protein